MADRFRYLGLRYEFTESPAWDDPSIRPDDGTIAQATELGRWSRGAWSCAHGHDRMLSSFLASDERVGIMCEDDIMIRRDFSERMPAIIDHFEESCMDVLLLGYLHLRAVPADRLHAFSYLGYDDQLWGTQMYMVSRSYAERLSEEYGPMTGYPVRSLLDPNLTPYGADWIMTKKAERRAMLLPMMAVEEGIIVDTAATSHVLFHQRSRDINHVPGLHI